MLLYCASFRWRVMVMKQLRERKEENRVGKLTECNETTGK
jgi:hypothetical protein